MSLIQNAIDANENRVYGASVEHDLLGLIKHLPKPVQSKIAGLLVDRDSTWAGMMHRQELASAAYGDWKDIERRYKQQQEFEITTAEDGSPIYKTRRGEEADCSLRLTAAYESWKRASVNIPALQEKWESYAFLQEIKDWLHRNEVNKRHKKPAGVTVKGADHTAQVEKMRGEIADLDVKIQATESAPATTDDLIARAYAEIDRIAALGAIQINPSDRSGPVINLDWNPYLQRGGNMSPHHLLWLFAEETKAKVATQIREEAPATGALTDAQRTKELERLAELKLGRERIEEAHIVAAHNSGLFIARRREASPLAILEVA